MRHMVQALGRCGTARPALGISVAVVGAWLGVVGCTADDASAPVTVPTGGTVTTPVSAPGTAPVTTTDTAPTDTATDRAPAPESVIGDQVASIEVSARMLDGDTESVWTISVGRSTLDTVEALGAEQSVAWCTGSAEADGAAPYLVRIGPPAVDTATGAVERFEIVAAHDVVGPGSVGAVLDAVVDGRSLTANDAVLDLLDDRGAGTFRAITPDGVLIEGAFRCT
jgi:hypothetical protein